MSGSAGPDFALDVWATEEVRSDEEVGRRRGVDGRLVRSRGDGGGAGFGEVGAEGDVEIGGG